MRKTERSGRTERTSADELVRWATERVPAERLEAVEGFIRAYARRLPGQLSGRSAEEVAAQALGAFRLADGRGSAEAAVRAFDPDTDRDGYTTHGSVLETNAEDAPFLVDSVEEELESRGLEARVVIHPVIGTRRGPDGRIERVLDVREAALRESVMHFEVDRRLPESELADLEGSVRRVLGDVHLAVRDVGAMRERVEAMTAIARAGTARYAADEIDEVVRFLRWLLEDDFVFLGYREYAFVDLPEGRAWRTVEGTGLGILTKPGWSSFEQPVPLDVIDPGLRARIEGGDLLVCSKTNRASTVHRRARMDLIAVRRVSEDGEILGEARVVGLFTAKAYTEPASRTPLLRGKLARILDAEDIIEGSHDHKAVVSIFDGFPKDELLAAPTEELRQQVTTILDLQEDRRVRLFVRRDVYGRSVSLLVVLPHDVYTADLGDRLRELFRSRFKGSSIDSHLSLGEGQLVRLHVAVHVGFGEVPEVPFAELERQVIELTRTWNDRLLERLVASHGEERGHALFERWGHRLPETYTTATPVEVAAVDVERFEQLERGDRAFLIGIANEERGGHRLTRIRLYKAGGRIELSDFVPTLESLGLRIVEEVPTSLLHRNGDERFLHDFGVLGPDGRPLDVEAVGEAVAGSIAAVWSGDCENDSLNRLVVTAGLDWRHVQILRAYRKYHHRVHAGFPVEYKNAAFAAHPEIAARLVRLFELRFDPDLPRDPAGVDALRAEILLDLDAVTSLEQDRILRNALGVIEATVRTNAYQPDGSALALKLRSALVPEMPEPAPLYEIFVYSTEVEGIHLRGGKVARGGIRWSDRRQDYRTEVLGLMKAQMVKNAVIVPVGAKGGFVLKREISDPGALRDEGLRQYATFIRALLDVTDNLVAGEIVHPPHVVVHDEDDPYLVVAADKGTATFSDTANAIAAEYGFWLGDAFASGGSSGYDHKALGITARGAWESVKRHFRELGTDVMTEPFTVVGIGDMSGDVFGNGMLLSEQICLVAAFDHRHVFIDPSPNPAVGFAERRRLFELPGSSWDDYDRSRISAGGGVWPRTAKRVPVSAEARLALGIDAEELTPDELIGAILRAPVDLLYNGGIGTYVKASTESNPDVGDRANDGLRVDGRDLRCRVVAEGGNLGLTQRGRIEYAARGGRGFTDFIDNSAGVDCSDHEVNLKILLGLAERRGELTSEHRDALLAEVEQDVVRHVLYDNSLQARILSQEFDLSPTRMEAYEDLMRGLETVGTLDRELAALPSAEEMADRRRAGRGLSRPELAVLLAHAKQSLADALVVSTFPDSDHLERDLRGYFPPRVIERFGHIVTEHPLRRELVATIVANDVVNSQGITYVARTTAESGARAGEVVSAYRIARDVTGAVARWEAVGSLVGRVGSEILDELMAGVDRLVEVTSRWYLANAPGELGPTIDAHAGPFHRLEGLLPTVGSERWRQTRRRRAWRLMDQGVPEELSTHHAFGSALVHAPNIIEVARVTGRDLDEVARGFLLVGEAVHIDRLEERLASVPTGSRWHRWALQAAEDDLLSVRRQVVERVLREGEGLEEALGAFLSSRAGVVERLGRFMSTFAQEEVSDLAAVTVAVHQIRALAS